MSIKKGRFYLTFKSSLIAFFLIKFFVNYSQPFCNLTATLQQGISQINFLNPKIQILFLNNETERNTHLINGF